MRNLTALQDRPVEVRGKAPWATRVDAALPRPPFTVLCRTNAGVVGAVVDAVSDVLTLAPGQIKPAPEFSAALETQFITGLGVGYTF